MLGYPLLVRTAPNTESPIAQIGEPAHQRPIVDEKSRAHPPGADESTGKPQVNIFLTTTVSRNILAPRLKNYHQPISYGKHGSRCAAHGFVDRTVQ